MKETAALTPAAQTAQEEAKKPAKPKKKPFAALRSLFGRDKKQPLYRRWWMIVLLLLLVPPAGIALVWTQKKKWPVWIKLVLTVLSAAMLLWAVIRSASVTV